FFCIFLFLLMARGYATQLPLTAKDVGLMLRGGYSSASVMQELPTRHFVDTLDAAKEEMLVKAGATPDLMAALNNGTYSLSREQNAIAQQMMSDQAKRRE